MTAIDFIKALNQIPVAFHISTLPPTAFSWREFCRKFNFA